MYLYQNSRDKNRKLEKLIVTDLKPPKSDVEGHSCYSKTALCNPASAAEGKLLVTAFVNL